MTDPLDELERKVYFYGDACGVFQSECEYGKSTVQERNLKIRVAGDELLAQIHTLIDQEKVRARLDESAKHSRLADSVPLLEDNKPRYCGDVSTETITKFQERRKELENEVR